VSVTLLTLFLTLEMEEGSLGPSGVGRCGRVGTEDLVEGYSYEDGKASARSVFALNMV
jgi:hypothetical protein